VLVRLTEPPTLIRGRLWFCIVTARKLKPWYVKRQKTRQNFLATITREGLAYKRRPPRPTWKNKWTAKDRVRPPSFQPNGADGDLVTSPGVVPRPFCELRWLSNGKSALVPTARGSSTLMAQFVPKGLGPSRASGSFATGPYTVHARNQIRSQISGVAADSRGTIGYVVETLWGQTMNPAPCILLFVESHASHPCHHGTSWSRLRAAARHTEWSTCSRGINSQKTTLASSRQRATYHGRVSSDDSRAIQKSHLSVPPSQYRLGERPPVASFLSPFRHISLLTHNRAQLEAFSDFCDALQLEKHAILLVLPAQRIELLHFSGRSSIPGRTDPLGCPQAFQWISRI